MPNAPRTARALARAELTRAILDSAGTQLAQVGPAALSVRAVARDLEMASSAVYRYFESRDVLLTALILEAYDDLGDAVEAGDAGAERDDLTGRLHGIAHALRGWAIEHPHRYALLYGSPVPGYAAPTDTIAPATRVAFALLEVVRDAQTAGLRPTGPQRAVSDAELIGIAPVMGFTDPPLEPVFAVRGLTVWATLFGSLSLELFGHMHNGVLDYEAHWAQLVDRLAADLGLTGDGRA